MKIKNKNTRDKIFNIHYWLLITIIAAVVGIVVVAILGQPITNFVKSNILNQEPYPSISITKIYRIDNSQFINFSEEQIIDEEGIIFHTYLLEEGDLMKAKSINIRMDTKEAYYSEDEAWTKGLMYPTDFVDETGHIYQKNCILHFFSHINEDSNPKNNLIQSYVEWPVKKENRFANLSEFAISVKNGGTEVIKDIYLEFCPDVGKIIYSEGGEISEDCLLVEEPYLYPGKQKNFLVYLSGDNLGKISLHSDMDKRKIPNYVINGILVVYQNSTCKKQTEVSM